MDSEFRVRELVLGIEGLALLRNAIHGDDEFLAQRVAEIKRFSGGSPEAPPDQAAPDGALPDGTATVRELTAAAGYEAWSSVYDSLPSSFIEVEEPVLHAMIDRGPVGAALDAACGTGRQSAALTARGFRTTGVDQSPHMLEKARAKAPEAVFKEGYLESLPLADDTVDLAVCSLAMTHLADLTDGVAELARVVRPGGRIIISDLHPFVVSLQGQCLFVAGSDRLAYVRNHVHLPSDYLAAFRAAGLTVRDCQEPVFNGRLAPGGYEEFIADAARAAWEGIPLVIVWEVTVP